MVQAQQSFLPLNEITEDAFVFAEPVENDLHLPEDAFLLAAAASPVEQVGPLGVDLPKLFGHLQHLLIEPVKPSDQCLLQQIECGGLLRRL